jgi:hypothetical protein
MRWRVAQQGAAAIIAAMIATLGWSAAGAQDTTPAAYPVAPDPAECVVAPRSMDDNVRIVGTPIPGGNMPAPAPEASPAPFAIPPGVPADTETADAVIATLHQVFACTNGGQLLRVYALFTDDFVREFFAQTPLTEDVIAFLAATPQPLPEEQQRIIRGFGGVQILDDGRAGVMIVLDEPDDPRRDEPDYAILARVAGRWLVDEIHEDAGLAVTPGP